MLATTMRQPARPACPTARPFEPQVLNMLNAMMVSQDEILKRLVRMETRMVNLMAVHNLDRDGQPARCGGTV